LIEDFGIERGLRKGDAPSTTLFIIVLEKEIRNTETKPNGTIFSNPRQYGAYADYVMILGPSTRATEEVIQINLLKPTSYGIHQ
jgi:hypothetical protein